jgi:hypothetical protein
VLQRSNISSHLPGSGRAGKFSKELEDRTVLDPSRSGGYVRLLI